MYIPPNLYIIGTANLDETTYSFSPKVLDRAFVIEVDTSLDDLYINKDNIEKVDAIYIDFKHNINWDKYTYIPTDFLDENNIEDKVQYIKGKLSDINKEIKKYDFIISPRTFKDIVAIYLNYIKSYEDENEAFDIAIKTKFLPKFHSTIDKVEEPLIILLKKLIDLPEENINSLQQALKEKPLYIEDQKLKVDSTEYTVNYPHSIKKILKMLRSLYINGYTTFM